MLYLFMNAIINIQVLPLWEIVSPLAFQIYEYTNYKYERIMYPDGLSGQVKSYYNVTMCIRNIILN